MNNMEDMTNEQRAAQIADGLAKIHLSWEEVEAWNPSALDIPEIDATKGTLEIVTGEPLEENFEEKRLQMLGVMRRIYDHLKKNRKDPAPPTQLAEELASDVFVKNEIAAIRDEDIRKALLDEIGRHIFEAAMMKEKDGGGIDRFGWEPDDHALDFEVMERAQAKIRERFERIFENTLVFGKTEENT